MNISRLEKKDGTTVLLFPREQDSEPVQIKGINWQMTNLTLSSIYTLLTH